MSIPARVEGIFVPYATRLSYLALGPFITEVRRLKTLESSEAIIQLLEQERGHLQWRKERDEQVLQTTNTKLAEIMPEALAHIMRFREAVQDVFKREGTEEARRQLKEFCERIKWVRAHIILAFVLRAGARLQNVAENFFPGQNLDDIGIGPDDALPIEERLFLQSPGVEHCKTLQARKRTIERVLEEDVRLRLEAIEDAL